MNIRQNSNALSCAAIFAAGMSVCVWLLAATPSRALVDTSHVLSGGADLGEGISVFTSPGVGPQNVVAAKGESKVQLRMPAGVLSTLRVKVTAQNEPTSGILAVTVRKNGLNTTLTCQVARSGACNGAGNINFAANDLLSIRVSNGLVGANTVGVTYTLQFN